MIVTRSKFRSVQRSQALLQIIHCSVTVWLQFFNRPFSGSTRPGMSVQALTHAQKVTRLYRKSLKHLLSWKVYRNAWRVEALELRAIFDENKDIKNVAKATTLLKQGEAYFDKWKHPDPYISPEAPEGTKWERNLPLPPHVLEMTPEEQQWLDDWMKNAPR